MKALQRPYRLRFHVRMGLCAALMTFAFIILTGESDSPHWFAILLLQVALSLSSLALAFWLYAKWGLGKIEKRIELIQQQRNKIKPTQI